MCDNATNSSSISAAEVEVFITLGLKTWEPEVGAEVVLIIVSCVTASYTI